VSNIKELKKFAQDLSVLYVEDDSSIQMTMKKYLLKFFKRVDSANDGLEGLELYKKNKYNLVITDLSMPNMNGLEMLRKIRILDEDQVVLITSAHSETNYFVEAIKVGIDGYIIKPFDFDQLNYELKKITLRVQKYLENDLYKKNLEDMIYKKSALVSFLLDFQNKNYEQTLYSMVEMIEDRDTYTAGHSQRVANYAKMIAEDMGYSQEECLKIYQAGMLHDIGKIATPDAVLLNPSHLNDIEYTLIKEHVNVGYRLLKHVPMFQSLAEIVYSHHERYDGGGYPRGLSGDEITKLARILIVADAFDAMTTSRVYKSRKTISEAIQEIKNLSSKQFHPEVVAVSVKTLKNVVIDNTINQVPISALEEKRFAYFYKDTLTDLYNKNYLELLLNKNTYEHKYQFLEVLFVKDFSKYNKKHSWSEGDKFLREFADFLKEKLPNEIIFRVFGDDFVILGNEVGYFEQLKEQIDIMMKTNDLFYKYINVDLEQHTILNLNDIEELGVGDDS
jgi:putative nucleotidyltransferase with HDIG domain/diguanylate cyclase (GGDEF)-like protein